MNTHGTSMRELLQQVQERTTVGPKVKLKEQDPSLTDPTATGDEPNLLKGLIKKPKKKDKGDGEIIINPTVEAALRAQDRETGTDSLVQAYKEDTPGQVVERDKNPFSLDNLNKDDPAGRVTDGKKEYERSLGSTRDWTKNPPSTKDHKKSKVGKWKNWDNPDVKEDGRDPRELERQARDYQQRQTMHQDARSMTRKQFAKKYRADAQAGEFHDAIRGEASSRKKSNKVEKEKSQTHSEAYMTEIKTPRGEKELPRQMKDPSKEMMVFHPTTGVKVIDRDKWEYHRKKGYHPAEEYEFDGEIINESVFADLVEKTAEGIVKGMKKNQSYFDKKYGDRADAIMYATANKLATEHVIDEKWYDPSTWFKDKDDPQVRAHTVKPKEKKTGTAGIPDEDPKRRRKSIRSTVAKVQPRPADIGKPPPGISAKQWSGMSQSDRNTINKKGWRPDEKTSSSDDQTTGVKKDKKTGTAGIPDEAQPTSSQVANKKKTGSATKAPERSAATSRAGKGGEQYRNRTPYKFAGKPGQGVVTKNELDKWRIHTSKPKGSLQDYIKARDGKKSKLEVPKLGPDDKPVQPDTLKKGKPYKKPGLSPGALGGRLPDKKQTGTGGAQAATVKQDGPGTDRPHMGKHTDKMSGVEPDRKKDPKSHGDRLGVTLPPSPHGPKMSRLKYRQQQKKAAPEKEQGTAVDRMLRDRNVDTYKDKDGKIKTVVRDKHAANLNIKKSADTQQGFKTKAVEKDSKMPHMGKHTDKMSGVEKDTQGTGIPKKITPPPKAKPWVNPDADTQGTGIPKELPKYDWQHGKADRMGKKLKYPHGYNQKTGKKLQGMEGGLRMKKLPKWLGGGSIEVDSRDSAYPKSADESVVDAYAEFITDQINSGIRKGHVR